MSNTNTSASVTINFSGLFRTIRRARDEQARLKSGMNMWAWQQHKKNKKK